MSLTTFDAHIRKCLFCFYRRVELSNNSIIIAIYKSDVLFKSKFHKSFKAKLYSDVSWLVEVLLFYFVFFLCVFCVMCMGRVDAPGLNKLKKNKIFGLTVRIKELENYKADTEKAALMQESYNKRLNTLIHGIEEDEDSVWESHQQTLEKFDEFLKNALEMDHDDIEIADIHRLPQTLQSRKGVWVNRPIIVKLSHAMDKKQFFSNLKRLKSFNTMRRTASKSTIFVTEHLPKVFLQKKKLVMRSSRLPKKTNKKPPGVLKMVNTFSMLIMKK